MQRIRDLGSDNVKELLSVIVPVYNVAGYLDRCVKSLINQSYSQLQIILVDDGSTDDSGKICDILAQRDSRIEVIHKENGGLSDARNAGIERAKGRYIAFLDSDDYIHVNMYEALIEQLELHGADIAECKYKKVFDTQEDKTYRGCAVEICNRDEALIQLMQWLNFDISVWNKVYKRELIEGLPFKVGKIHEDEFWTYQVLFRVKKAIHLDFAFHYYQQSRKGSILTASFSEKNYDSTEALFERLEFMEKNAPEFVDEAKASILVHFFHHLTNLSVRDSRPRSVRLPYFVRFTELLCEQPKSIIEPYCNLSKKKRIKVHFCRMIGKISPRFLYCLFYIVQKIQGRSADDLLEQ